MIKFDAILWDDPSDPGGNVRHVADHGLTTEEVEGVLFGPNSTEALSASSARRMRFGWTDTGRFIAVVYLLVQTRTRVAAKPVTAYDVPPH